MAASTRPLGTGRRPPAFQLAFRDLEERGELLREGREAADAAVGVVQDHQMPVWGLALAKSIERLVRAWLTAPDTRLRLPSREHRGYAG